ncbi:MAG: acyl-CoA dehydratase activase [Dehalococcoidales bacterium]|nr:acyl-CoA dehydratase activase [Dehalococcoidales bacterium]
MVLPLYLGIDVGAVSAKFAVLDGEGKLISQLYLPTGGRPLAAVRDGLARLVPSLPPGGEVRGVAVTGSARELVGAAVGADMVKNEITCQAVGALHSVPGVRTVIEIGGQDSKIIIIREGMVVDFGLNTVCAAGTGSFLDHQAARLQMSIEEFSRRALLGSGGVTISGRCTVFAESDMIHKQQSGCPLDDVIYGLCRALVRNFLSSVASGKEILPPVVFQGGVASNAGMVRAFREELGMEITVLPHHRVTGAIGAALLVGEASPAETRFRGFRIDAGAVGPGMPAGGAPSAGCRGCPRE